MPENSDKNGVEYGLYSGDQAGCHSGSLGDPFGEGDLSHGLLQNAKAKKSGDGGKAGSLEISLHKSRHSDEDRAAMSQQNGAQGVCVVGSAEDKEKRVTDSGNYGQHITQDMACGNGIDEEYDDTGKEVIAVDLPGAYSMSPFTSEESITSSYVKKKTSIIGKFFGGW